MFSSLPKEILSDKSISMPKLHFCFEEWQQTKDVRFSRSKLSLTPTRQVIIIIITTIIAQDNCKTSTYFVC
jgi:hypothetical protein